MPTTIPQLTPEYAGQTPATSQTIFYTDTELMKIYVCGALLALAILFLAYYGYRWWNARYLTWCRQKEAEEKIAAGINVDIDGIEPVPVGVDRKWLFLVGILIVVVGIVQIAF